MFLTSLLMLGATAPIRPAGFVLAEPVVFADPPKMNEWTGAVNVGASWSEGNSERRTANAGADAEYRREKDRTTLKFLWNFAEDKNASPRVTDRRVYGAAKYDYFVAEKTFVYAETSAESSFASALDARSTFGVGVGRQFREDEQWKVSAEAGLSYVIEDLEQPGENAEFLAARVAYKTEYKPDDKWTFGHDGEVFPSLEDSDDVLAKTDTKARVSLTDTMFAQAQWLMTYDNTPASGAERKDDLYLLGIGWTF